MAPKHSLFTANTTDTDAAYRTVLARYGSLDHHAIELFKDGFDHIVYVVDGTDAFRFPKNQEYAKKMPIVSRFLQYFHTLSPIAVPLSQVETGADGSTYEHYLFLPGQPLKEQLSHTFSDSNLQNIGREIGSFLTILHASNIDDALTLGLEEDDTKNEWLRRYNGIKQHVTPLLDTTENAKVDMLFSDYFTSLSKSPPVQTVTHYDIKPDHIIVNPDTQQLQGIIDFGDMRVGDPAFDFTYFSRYSPLFVRSVLDGYTSAKDDAFMHRMRFYQMSLPVMDLAHALSIHTPSPAVKKLLHLAHTHIATIR